MVFFTNRLAKILVLLVPSFSLFILTSCESGGGSTTPGMRIAVIPKGTTHSFWDSIHAGALAGAAELKAELDLDCPKKERRKWSSL